MNKFFSKQHTSSSARLLGDMKPAKPFGTPHISSCISLFTVPSVMIEGVDSNSSDEVEAGGESEDEGCESPTEQMPSDADTPVSNPQPISPVASESELTPVPGRSADRNTSSEAIPTDSSPVKSVVLNVAKSPSRGNKLFR